MYSRDNSYIRASGDNGPASCRKELERKHQVLCSCALDTLFKRPSKVRSIERMKTHPTMMALPRLALDIVVPPAVLSRRGGVSMTGIIIRTFLQDTLRRSPEIMLDRATEQNALIERISEEAAAAIAGDAGPPSCRAAEEGDEPSELDELERLLLAKFDVSQYRPKHTGRFLTMHKRRRKRLVTRSLDQEPGLLDDVSHGQVQCVLQRVANWKFNAFTLETATGGRSLPVLCVHLFHWYGLLEHFNLDVVRVWKLFTLIEEGYHSTNPYHNSIHAADVTQAMHCFLQEEQIRRHLSYLEIMASLIAAVTHDLDHPGVNQPFLVATSNHLAALYENTSVLENHHWRSAVGCLLESGVSEQLPDRVKPELQRHISSLILATDITRQQEFLTRFKRYLDERELDMEQPEHRHFILQIALKCADISNPCRPWDISRKWSYKVCEEFFRQGDYERQLNLPVTALCDRHTTSIPKIQAGFFKFVVLPLYEEWHRFLDDDFSRSLMRHLRANQQHWELMIQEEAAGSQESAQQPLQQQACGGGSEPVTEAIEPSEVSAAVLDYRGQAVAQTLGRCFSQCTEEDSGSLELPMPSPASLAPPGLQPSLDRAGEARRHSVPLGVCRSLSLAPRPTTARRESLPGAASLVPSRVSSRSSLHRGSEASAPSAALTCSSISPAAPERPVSAENLLPDTSIASIANSLEASRLSSLVQQQQQQQQPWEQALHDSPGPQAQPRQAMLTRQQTFPPVQPYARMRYMSTTAEMSQCCTAEVLLEADSSSSRSGSPAPASGLVSSTTALESPSAMLLSSSSSVTGNVANAAELRRHSTPAQSKTRSAELANATGRRFTTIPLTQEPGQQQQQQQQQQQHKVFFIGSPPDSPPRQQSATPTSDGSGSSVDHHHQQQQQQQQQQQAQQPSRKSADSLSLPGSKRDYAGDSARDKNVSCSSKMLKLMKENVDPRAVGISDDLAVNSKALLALGNRRSNNQGLARRRGSAPVGLMLASRLDDSTSASVRSTIDIGSRRGSVPADITTHPNGGINRVGLSIRSEKLSVGNNCSRRRSSLPHEAALGNLLAGNLTQLTADRENYPLNNNNSNNNNNNNNTGSNNNGFPRLTVQVEGASLMMSSGESVLGAIPSSRRGSVPADISELRRDPLGRNSLNGSGSVNPAAGLLGKSRNIRSSKKLLRRRRSGGPEMFTSGQQTAPALGAPGYQQVDAGNNENAGGWPTTSSSGCNVRSKRDFSKRDSFISEPSGGPVVVVPKRRGSLPIEMLTVPPLTSRYIHR
ncbi:uncharacterized protein LOC100114896 isoform X2 [Nasonia vitripennis]|uniref:Phosphodiesterase n=1 Tax=Nasonia vitripennis TaxID=7425 RepID=A0A7M7Q2M1_NASVI|nr:uncharacterized protein LOC100114896 isoform X2 [Nasonia vitripennis]